MDDAVEAALLAVVQPAAAQAALAAEAQAMVRRDEAREAMTRDLEAARYAADRAFRQYDAADPLNRFVAGELETRWNRALTRVAEIAKRIGEHDAMAPARSDLAPISFAELAKDLQTVWAAPTTDARLKKRIARTVIHDIRTAFHLQTVNNLHSRLESFMKPFCGPATKNLPGYAAWFITRLTGDETAAHGAAWQRLLAA